jgi:hypothetical protein
MAEETTVVKLDFLCRNRHSSYAGLSTHYFRDNRFPSIQYLLSVHFPPKLSMNSEFIQH